MVDAGGAVLSLLVGGGGAYGYAKTGNIPSLLAGLTIGTILLVGSRKYNEGDPNVLFGGSLALAGVMGYRYAVSGKLVPPATLFTLG
ncbi:unnamed protein product [Hymenolepis diminuta]|nr:unnamed protein product [Hymenolepis diminuta]